ncbi:2-amino-4-hydroxy-6-hydroxymethyldihydropteridine diphosphokinase [Psychromarinibacter sp. S121]|uniref:2-amino-4-hydroxy-6- hydroxymethyldihydropteridine diphosphokinase n=1 Tax=Psychromarinibacter sp. S121 TaxID=3415127 RepID=UPI003C79F2EF
MRHNSVTSDADAVIALGANLASDAGPPEATLRAALEFLGDSGLHVRVVSPFYATPCFPAGAGPDYVNAAAILAGGDGPQQVLETLHAAEAAFGRERLQRWGSRVLDLDLIAMGDAVLPDSETHETWVKLPASEQGQRAPDQLILPHPRLQDRAFVLVPLLDVAPDWRHPVTGITVREMVAKLPEADRVAVRPL